MNIKKFTSIALTSTFLLIIILLATVFQSRDMQSDIHEKEHQRFTALLLAQELFQSSEDLTRMARAYVVTGDPIYKKYFSRILAIRNGEIPRPSDYTTTYWHLEGIGKSTATATATALGEVISLQDLMRKVGLSADELALLRESESNSNKLVALERQAFAAVEGLFDNGHGEYIVPGEPDRALAQRLLWGDDYVNEKARIMLPIREFMALLDVRTQNDLDVLQEKLRWQILIELSILVMLLAGSIVVVMYLRKHVLQPLVQLIRQAGAIANGDYSARCESPGSNEIALLGKNFDHMAEAVQQAVANYNQANNLLQHNELRLKEAQYLAQVGNWELDINSGVLHWSDEIFRIFEINQKKFGASYESFLDTIHPEDRDKVNQAYTQSLATREPYEITHRLLMPDGRIKWVVEHCRTFYDDEDKPIRSVGAVQDITESKQAEETISLYASVFKQSGEAIIITDARNKILAVNEAFHKLTGYSQEEVLGKNPFMLVAPKDAPEAHQALWHIMDRKDFWQGEIISRHKDGHSYTIWLAITAVRGNWDKVSYYISSFTDISEHKAATDRIHYLAHHDTLTDLPNRLSLIDHLKQAIHSARRNKERIAVMFVDLDRFKTINDTLGHHVGDLLLVEVAQRLKSCTRSNDIVARLGGDEFVVVLPELESMDATFHVADKILHALGKSYLLNGHNIHSSPSIGIAFFPDDGDNVDDVMKNADVAMYHAKSKGRNNYQFFESSMNQATLERLELEHDMRIALEREEFVLHYQPKISADTLRVSGVEALVRWQHPRKGLIPPGTFIPLAEESGLMLPLGEWVLRTACHQLKLWQEQGMADLQISVNLSARQFRQENLPMMVASVITEENMDPTLLELEITESMAMDDPQKTIESMNELRRIGVKLAIDDFGTGYSSISYLKQFPVDTLKLDRSYVKDVETDSGDAAICAATISLAHDLGLEVVAEGVETEKQYEYLKLLDCDKFQGYHFCKPLPASEAEAYILAYNSNALFQTPPVSPIDILVIDDDKVTCELHKYILENLGHKPTAVLDPVAGLEMVRKAPGSFRLIMVDMLMPNMSGVDLIKAIRKINPDVPIVVISSYDIESMRKTLRPLEKKHNLFYEINYFILEKPLMIESIKEIISKII